MRAAAVVLSLALTSTAAAQPVPANALSVNALDIAVKAFGSHGIPFELEYERALGDRFSVYVTPRFTFVSNELATGFGLGASLGARWYVYRGPAVAGLWLGADVGTDYRSDTARGTDATITGFDGFLVRAVAGYNLLVGPLYVSPGIGVEYRYPELPVPHLRISVGYAF